MSNEILKQNIQDVYDTLSGKVEETVKNLLKTAKLNNTEAGKVMSSAIQYLIQTSAQIGQQQQVVEVEKLLKEAETTKTYSLIQLETLKTNTEVKRIDTLLPYEKEKLIKEINILNIQKLEAYYKGELTKINSDKAEEKLNSEISQANAQAEVLKKQKGLVEAQTFTQYKQTDLVNSQVKVQDKQAGLLDSQTKTDTFNRDNVLPEQKELIKSQTNTQYAQSTQVLSQAELIKSQKATDTYNREKILPNQAELISKQALVQEKQSNLLSSQAKTDTYNRDNILPLQSLKIQTDTQIGLANIDVAKANVKISEAKVKVEEANVNIAEQSIVKVIAESQNLLEQKDLIEAQTNTQYKQANLLDSQAKTDTVNREKVLPSQTNLIKSQTTVQIAQNRLINSQADTDTYNRDNILSKQKDLIGAQKDVQTSQKGLIDEQTKTQEVNTYLTEAKMEVELGYEIASTGLKKKDDFENSLSGLNIKKLENETKLVDSQTKVQKMQGVGLQLKTFYDTGILTDDIVSNNSLKFETDNNQLVVKYGDNTTIKYSTLLQQIRALKGQTVGYDKTVQLKVLELVSKIITDSLSTDDVEPPKWAVETFVYLTSQLGKSAFSSDPGINLNLQYTNQVNNIDDVLLQLQTTYRLGYLSNLGIVDSTTGLLNDSWKIFKVSDINSTNDIGLLFTSINSVNGNIIYKKKDNSDNIDILYDDNKLVEDINPNIIKSTDNILFVPTKQLHSLGLSDGLSLTNYYNTLVK